MNRSTLIITAIILAGCGPSERAMAISSSNGLSKNIEGSIFPSDQGAGSNDDIIKVLEGKVPIKEGGSLAILSIGDMQYIEAGYGDRIKEKIHSELKGNKYVGSVITVPKMLMPTKVSVSNIREMGARLQCENVLVYTSYSDYRYDTKIFSKSEVRACLTIEGVVVNVRTGCMPLAVSVDKEAIIKEVDADYNRYEFYNRAKRECLMAGISDICTKINLVIKESK